MRKIITDFLCVCVLCIVLEGVLYFRDYNDLMIMKEYFVYEIKNNDLKSFRDEKYEMCLTGENKFSLTLYRDSLFVFDKYKKIKYDGIVY